MRKMNSDRPILMADGMWMVRTRPIHPNVFRAAVRRVKTTATSPLKSTLKIYESASISHFRLARWAYPWEFGIVDDSIGFDFAHSGELWLLSNLSTKQTKINKTCRDAPGRQ
jgi:hypothetical protein